MVLVHTFYQCSTWGSSVQSFSKWYATDNIINTERSSAEHNYDNLEPLKNLYVWCNWHLECLVIQWFCSLHDAHCYTSYILVVRVCQTFRFCWYEQRGIMWRIGHSLGYSVLFCESNLNKSYNTNDLQIHKTINILSIRFDKQSGIFAKGHIGKNVA